MFIQIQKILQGLVDGTNPLPPPFPQTLNFTKHRRTARHVASFVARHLKDEGFDLSYDELRHLLFKIASHITRAGRGGQAFYVYELLTQLWPAVAMTLRSNPEWLKSKAGVPWAIEYYENWTRALDKQGRTHLGETPRVADVEWYPGYFLVELMNGRHVHAEGKALGHCMSWSLNREALAKHGYPPPATPEAMECLTYAVKIRHGELRVFSLRSPENTPLMTLSYSMASKQIEEMRGDKHAHYPFGWSDSHCALFKALSSLVELQFSRFPQWGGCLRRCPGNGWCEGVIKFRGDSDLPFAVKE